MDNKENCIQLKIDSIISDINQNNEAMQNEEKNQITALIGYSHCLDLYEFLKLYSKVQKNELLFQVAIIYDSIGYSELSMEYIDQALLLIPNVPSIILYKCGLFANQNKLDEAQKWLLKYKYLIGENKYDNYVHDSFQTIIYFLLEYEEFIILRKITSMEKKYNNYIKENFILYFIKSQILEKLAQKIKNADNKRYISYIKESNKIKNTYLKNKANENEFLREQGVKPENFTKLLYFITPNCLNYRPKKLDEYKNNFVKSGFDLFYTLIKICKIFKLKIEINKYNKFQNKNSNKDKENKTENNNINNINDIMQSIFESPKKNKLSNSSNELINEKSINKNKESIKKLYNSVWLNNFLNGKNPKHNLEIKNIDPKILKANYFTKKGFYSHLNLDDNIIKYIKYNNEYKQNNLKDDLFLEEITLRENDQKKNSSLNNNENNDITNHKNNEIVNNANIILCKSKTNNNSNKDLIKISPKETKRTQNDSSKFKRIKISLSDIIKNVISKRPKEPNKNKKNKIINNENDTKSKKFCSTNNSNNQLISRSLINNNNNNNTKNKNNIIKLDSNVIKLQKSKNYEDAPNKVTIKKKSDTIKFNDDLKKPIEKKEDFDKEEERNQNKTEKNLKIPGKNEINDHFIISLKKKEIKNINHKNKILSTSSSNKKISLINSKDKSKTINKNAHNNNPIFCFGDDKKMDTDYGKYKDVREINLVSYCLKQLMKKKENKNKKMKQKEIINLTDKMDLMAPQKIINIEKQAFQMNDRGFLKSRSKKKKFLNQSLKNQVNTFNYEKKITRKTTQKNSLKNSKKNSQNNLLSTNKNSYSSNALNGNVKNLKKTGFPYNNKKELSKFKSLKYLYGNFYSNNNYLNINFNNYMNYNYNYSNRHEDKKNLDFKFNQNSDKKRDDSSFSKDKFNFRTINLDFKNMSTKLNSKNKKTLINSFIDSKERNKKSSEKNQELVIMPFTKIKQSPGGEMYCLKKKIKNVKPNLIKQKAKTSFAKYMLYSIGKKSEVVYFSKSINTSEYSKYKQSSINNSKTMKSKYNKTLNSKSNLKINNK